METLRSYVSYAYTALTQVQLTPVVIGLVLIILLLVYYIRISDPRYEERRMAKKKERQAVCDLITKALDDALLEGKISRKTQAKYYRKLGHSLQLPDLIPGFFQPDLNGVKQRCKMRLDKMGVNIKEELVKVRLLRPHTKKHKLTLKSN
jgi:hypothetical protein